MQTPLQMLQPPWRIRPRWLQRSGSARTYEPAWGDGPFAELSRGLFWEAHESWKNEKRLAGWWTRWHYILGTLGVVLAGIAGFGGLTDLLGKVPTSWIALCAGLVTGVATFLQSDAKRGVHSQRAAAWDSFRDDVSTLFMTRPEPRPSENASEEWRSVIEALQTRARALRANQPDPHTSPHSWSSS